MRKPALCASLAVLALAAGASGQPQATSPGVLLSKHWLGVYRLVPSGAIQRLVGTDIRPLAVSADGDAAGVRASDKQRNGPLFIDAQAQWKNFARDESQMGVLNVT